MCDVRCAMCDPRCVAAGTPEDLISFVKNITENKWLTAEFKDLARSVKPFYGVARPEAANVEMPRRDPFSAAPGSPVGRTRLLGAVVKVLSGWSVAEIVAAGGELQRCVAVLARALADEDVSSAGSADGAFGQDDSGSEVLDGKWFNRINDVDRALRAGEPARLSGDAASCPRAGCYSSGNVPPQEDKLGSEDLWAAFAAVSLPAEEISRHSRGQAVSGSITTKWSSSGSSIREQMPSGDGLSGYGKSRLPDTDLRKTLFETAERAPERGGDSTGSDSAVDVVERPKLPHELRIWAEIGASVLVFVAVLRIVIHVHQRSGFQRVGDSIRQFADAIERSGDASADSDAGDGSAKPVSRSNNESSPASGARKTQSSRRYQSANEARAVPLSPSTGEAIWQ